MAKQTTKSGKQAPGQPNRTIAVSDGVHVVMAGLDQAEKHEVAASVRSAASLLRLPVEAIVDAPDGALHAARVTPNLYLIYRLDTHRVDVIDLLSTDAVRHLLHPEWMKQNDAHVNVKKRSVSQKRSRKPNASNPSTSPLT